MREEPSLSETKAAEQCYLYRSTCQNTKLNDHRVLNDKDAETAV